MIDAYGSAIAWLADAATGRLATLVAIIAVAAIGLRLMLGHFDPRRAGAAVLGCFLIFGAPILAAGIRDYLAGADQAPYRTEPHSPSDVVQAQPRPAYDPYAGAAPALVPVTKSELRDVPLRK